MQDHEHTLTGRGNHLHEGAFYSANIQTFYAVQMHKKDNRISITC